MMIAMPWLPLLALYASAHFTFDYPAVDAATIAATAAHLESEHARVVSALGVTDMPRVHVTLYADHAALEAATRSVAGVVPSWTYGLVTAEDRIHCMSPSQPGWGPYDRRMSDLVHEFAHGVTLHVNPRIANRPRWLWEAVAIYEAGQKVDLRTVPYMTAHRPPTFAELASIEDKRIYDVGYSISEFVVARWGAGALRELVVKNGDTAAVLGLSTPDFEAAWFAFVGTTYHL
jgi:hypothetical protein